MIAGVLSGLLGIGGGVTTIPLLLLVFTYFGFPPQGIMHLAIGTSLAAMVFNTLSASYAHYKRHAILFPIVKPMSLGVIVGAVIGALVARLSSSSFLQTFFGIFEAFVAIRFLLPEPKIAKQNTLPSFKGLATIALGVTTLSTMLGLGGGMMNVPILTHFNVPIKKAIGTSSALSFLISLFGALFFLLVGTDSTSIDDTLGYLYIPAFITISITSLCIAPYGTKLAHKLATHMLKKVFGLTLLIASIYMLFF